MKIFFAVPLTLALLSCETEAQKTERTSNAALSVDLLFEHEGCKVYRFADNGSWHYYVKCKSEAMTADVKPCGEDCVHSEEVPTVTIHN